MAPCSFLNTNTQSHIRRTAEDAGLPPKMQEPRKTSCASTALVIFSFISWGDWGFSAGCGGEVSLEAIGTTSRGTLEAWLGKSSEDVSTAVEVQPSHGVERGTLIGIPVALVRRKNSNRDVPFPWHPRIQQNSYSFQELLKYISEGFKCCRTHTAQPGQIFHFCVRTTHKEGTLLQTQNQEKSTLRQQGRPFSAQVATTGSPHCGTPTRLLGDTCMWAAPRAPQCSEGGWDRGGISNTF